MSAPLLTIAIPTYRRAPYLAKTLAHLHTDLADIASGSVDIVISDNASPDFTEQVVAEAIAKGMPITLTRNSENIGSDANIAQVFNMARGRYVLILGDDDILVPGELRRLVGRLDEEDWGLIFLRPYGYDHDLSAEFPGNGGQDKPMDDPGEFLVAVGQYLTLISSMVINKSLLAKVDARSFIGGNLVQVHLALLAMLHGRRNLFTTRYGVACKRNNSGGYLYARVFVAELSRIIASYVASGLSPSAIGRFHTKLLIAFHPTYALRARADKASRAETFDLFRSHYGYRPLFWLWVAPILRLPEPLARLWGWFAILVGRLRYGDMRRGVALLRARLLHRQ